MRLVWLFRSLLVCVCVCVCIDAFGVALQVSSVVRYVRT